MTSAEICSMKEELTVLGHLPFGNLSRTFIGQILAFAVVMLVSSGCSSETYSSMMDAVGSQLSSLTITEDQRNQRRLHQALVSDPGFSRLTLSTYVFMDRGYIVGHVDNPEQAKAIFNTAKHVKGLRSLDAFLPVKRAAPDELAENVTSNEATLQAQIKSALAKAPGVVNTRVSVEVLDDRVVLLGVVSGDEEKMRAERAAAGTSGVKRVTNWLLLPESQYMAIRTQVF